MFVGTLNKKLLVCQYLASGQVAAGFDGCYGLTPVFEWIKRCIISIFIVFFIAFLPLFLQGTSSILLGASQNSNMCLRIDRARNCQSCHSFGETFPFARPNLRGILDTDLHLLDLEQLDVRRCSIHRHRTRVCHHSSALQHSVLSIRRPQYLPRHTDAPYVALCLVIALVADPHLLLDHCHLPLHCPVHVQPASVLSFRLYHRLP